MSRGSSIVKDEASLTTDCEQDN